jgi:hypothetical protein
VAEYAARHVTTVRCEYALRLPTNLAEIGKIYAAIDQELKELGLPSSDNLVTVEASDEELVFWYERSREVTHV